jgi:S-DNA-T family DNA segregation ATPase FtsK/SpoIIIE
MFKITVSNLHLCQHCPRLLAYSLEGKKKAWNAGYLGTGNLRGKLFHEFVKNVQKEYLSNLNERKNLIEILNKDPDNRFIYFKEAIKTRYLIPCFIKYENSFSPDNITAFASATEKWLSYIFTFIAPYLNKADSPDTLLDMVFQNTESLISSDYTFNDGTVMNISGKPDALFFDPGTKEAVVVEYKGRKESDASQDLAQTSIYAWLVKQSTGMSPRVEILYFEEKIPLVRYDADSIVKMIQNHSSLFSLARKVITKDLPIPKTPDEKLCCRCQFKSDCENDFEDPDKISDENTGITKPGISVASKQEISEDAERYMDALV